MTNVNYPLPSPIAKLELHFAGGNSTEDVLVDEDGVVFTGLADGRIQRLAVDAEPTTIADTNGRPLGMEFLPDGRILICDAENGLLAADIKTGEITVLANQYEGKPIPICNNAAVASDGAIYFTSSTTRHEISEATKDIMQQVPTGRLFKCSPDGSLTVLLDGLYFANGVVLDPDEQFILVAETARAAIIRVWLAGPKAGQKEEFRQNLPGLPDNLSLGSDGHFWVALVAGNDGKLAVLRAIPFWLRWLISNLPEALKPKAEMPVRVMAFDKDANCVHHFHQDTDQYDMVTGVREHNGTVWMGSLKSDYVASYEIGRDTLVL